MLCLIPSSQTLAKCLCLVFSPRTSRRTGGFLGLVFYARERTSFSVLSRRLSHVSCWDSSGAPVASLPHRLHHHLDAFLLSGWPSQACGGSQCCRGQWRALLPTGPRGPQAAPGLRAILCLPFLLCHQHPCWFLWPCLPSGGTCRDPSPPQPPPANIPQSQSLLCEVLSLALPQHMLLCLSSHSTLKNSSALFT